MNELETGKSYKVVNVKESRKRAVIIKMTDSEAPMSEICSESGFSESEVLNQMDYIVSQGTCLNIDYLIDGTNIVRDSRLKKLRKSLLFRGINKEFAGRIKESQLYQLYMKHHDELIFGIRNGYVNLYYNCASIAKISQRERNGLRIEISSYYMGKSPSKMIEVNAEDIVKNYSTIKKMENKKSTFEKKSQERLFTLNNSNTESKWYCIDVEWAKQYINKQAKDEDGFNARFDIVAIEKAVPHHVAIIELKYGFKAIGKASGIKEHAEDFTQFLKKGYFKTFKTEVISIIRSLKAINVEVPKELSDIKETDISDEPLFYFIVLDNNPKKEGAVTPKQSIGSYMFNKENPKYSKWRCIEPSEYNMQDKSEVGDITDKSNFLHATFLFSKQKYESLQISDIINDPEYEIIEPE